MPKARRKPSKPVTRRPGLTPSGVTPTRETMAKGQYEITEIAAPDNSKPKVAINRKPIIIDAFSARHRDAAERIIEAYWTLYDRGGTKDPLDQRIRGAYSHLTESAIDHAIRCRGMLDGLQRRTGSHGYHLILRAAVFDDDPARWEPHVRAMLLDALDVAADYLLGPQKGC